MSLWGGRVREIPETPDSAVDVELSRGKGAVLVLVDSGPADMRVVPAADCVGHVEALELLSGNGGEAVAAEDAAVSLRRAEEDVVCKLVGAVASGVGNVALVDPAVGVGCGPAPVTRVPVDTNAEVVLVRGNGAEVVLVLCTLVVTEVDLPVVRKIEVLVVVDTDVTVVLFGVVDELEVAGIVVLGVKIDRGNVLRVDKREVVLA